MDPNIQAILDNANAAQATIDSKTADLASAQKALADAQAQIAALSNVSVFKNLHLLPATVAGGSVANSAGNTGVAADAQGVPGLTFAFRDIFPTGSYQDKYWYWQLGASPSKTSYTYELRLMLPTASDCAAAQAIELDIEQRINDEIFNVGFQWDFADQKTLNIWNRSASTPTVPHAWISLNIPCPRWNPGEWQTVKLEAHRTGNTVQYDAVTVNGLRIDLGTHSFPTITANKSDCLNCAVQLDANKAGTAYRLQLDAVDFTAK